MFILWLFSNNYCLYFSIFYGIWIWKNKKWIQWWKKTKLEKIINGKSILKIILTSLNELEESKTEIIEFPIYDYCDISGKFNIKKIVLFLSNQVYL